MLHKSTAEFDRFKQSHWDSKDRLKQIRSHKGAKVFEDYIIQEADVMEN